MTRNKTVYTVEVLSAYPEWWRYNVYMMLVGYDENDRQSGFNNLTDRVCEVSYRNPRTVPPADYKEPRIIRLESEPCLWCELYLYVIANTFPASEVIRDSPSFTLSIKISADNKLLSEREYEVNQWGGLTVVGYPIGKE